MSKYFRTTTVAATLCALALVFAAAVVEAQSEDPIMDDEILCSITVGEAVWAAPVAHQVALELHFGQPATLETMRQLLDRLPPASPTSAVRIEGGHLGLGVAQDLEALGYVNQMPLAPTERPGTLTGVLCTN